MTLSSKRQDTDNSTPRFKKYAYSEEDVREFIKKLKEEITRLQNTYNVVPTDYVFDKIDNLAGEKLTK